ncbi:MAG: glycosyltransferase [Candidatus Omnitrophota bacterium]
MPHIFSVSIIIPTHNRQRLLKEALLSLNGVLYPRDKLEVVVVDDGSTDNTEEAVNSLSDKVNYKLRFLREPKLGISHAKNAGVRNSSGEIIVSTDDDCMFEKDWLDKLLSAFTSEKVGVVGGPDKPFSEGSIFSQCADYVFTCFVGSGGVHGRFLPLRLGKFIPMGCNMAFRREVLNKVGLFNEAIAPGEETDLVHRIEKSGFLIGHSSDAFVWHRAIDNLKGFAKMIFKRGFARVEVIRNHGKYSELIYLLPALTVLSAALLSVWAIFSKAAFFILITLAAVYLLLVLSSSVVAFILYKNVKVLFLVPGLLILQHTLHGLGFWAGLLSFRSGKK